ncbi:MAG: dihydropyrimidinase [Pseudomonadota bacterium]
MADFDLIVKDGTVVTASDTHVADIGVLGGRIAALADNLPASQAETVIDATGKLVLPGGVEAHCHIDEPIYGGAVLADDFASGSVAAACGGTTTFIPFANQLPGHTLRQAVDDYHARAHGKSLIDYSFHMIVTDANEQVLGQELPGLLHDGYTSFKVFMTYDDFCLDDGEILNVLATAKRHGGFVMVHAENDHCIRWLAEQLERAGRTEPASFSIAHGPVVEREATHRAISLAEIVETPVFIVHVSSAQAMEQIAWAQSRGLPVYAETCPQYLFLSEEDFKREGWEGAKYVCSPPPRDPGNPDHLWRGLKNGTFQLVSSDHSPFRMEGPGGRIESAGELHFHKISPGIPGIEVRLPLMFSEGVNKGRIDLNHFVALTATNAAKLYGLYPQKGTIAIGSDADIVLWDPDRRVTIRHAMLHDAADYTPYEGFDVTGWPVLTLSRGEIVWRDGTVHGEPGRGRYLKRGASSAIQSFSARST